MAEPADTNADDTPALPVPGRIRPGVPTVTLGGLEWPMPPLAARQLRVVVPKLLKLIKHMIPVLTALEVARSMGAASNPLQQMELLDISEETMEDLTTVLHVALTRGSPNLTRDQFEDLPMDIGSLVNAFPVVLAATGMFGSDGQPVAALGVGGPNMGEVLTRSTGTG